jgi:hypothetical protein
MLEHCIDKQTEDLRKLFKGILDLRGGIYSSDSK